MEQNFEEFFARVPAKINLSLAITGKRGALHTLDMIVCPYEKFADVARFAPDGDELSSGGQGIRLSNITASFDGFDRAKFEKFFVPKLEKIATEYQISGELSLELGVPLGAGLGGSSAATVAALKAAELSLSFVGRGAKPSSDFLLSLGSDVPCMYVGGVCRVQGVGEIVTPLDEKAPDFQVFVPNFSCDSAACYAMYDKLLSEGKITPGGDIPTSVRDAARLLRNDLTLPAEALYPEIGKLLSRLRAEHGNAIMSGSGSACACILQGA